MMQRDTHQLRLRNNAFPSLHELSTRPDPESPNPDKRSPRWTKRTTCTLPSRKTFEGRIPSTRTTCVRGASGPTKNFVERKWKRVGTNQRSNRKDLNSHGLSRLQSQRGVQGVRREHASQDWKKSILEKGRGGECQLRTKTCWSHHMSLNVPQSLRLLTPQQKLPRQVAITKSTRKCPVVTARVLQWQSKTSDNRIIQWSLMMILIVCWMHSKAIWKWTWRPRAPLISGGSPCKQHQAKIPSQSQRGCRWWCHQRHEPPNWRERVRLPTKSHQQPHWKTRLIRLDQVSCNMKALRVRLRTQENTIQRMTRPRTCVSHVEDDEYCLRESVVWVWFRTNVTMAEVVVPKRHLVDYVDSWQATGQRYYSKVPSTRPQQQLPPMCSHGIKVRDSVAPSKSHVNLCYRNYHIPRAELYTTNLRKSGPLEMAAEYLKVLLENEDDSLLLAELANNLAQAETRQRGAGHCCRRIHSPIGGAHCGKAIFATNQRSDGSLPVCTGNPRWVWVCDTRHPNIDGPRRQRHNSVWMGWGLSTSFHGIRCSQVWWAWG